MQGYVTVFLLLEQKLRATFMDNFEPYQKWGIFVGYILNSNIFMYVYEIACVHQTKKCLTSDVVAALVSCMQ